jgi:uncharacterized membrane protein YkvA (DUF1232 family)
MLPGPAAGLPVLREELAMRKVLVGEILEREATSTPPTGFWPYLRKHAGRLPFAEDALAAWYCALDPAVPARVRAILFGALGYFVMPADLVPDVVALVGFTDDAAVLAAAIGAIRAHLRPGHREAARRALAGSQAPERG